MLMLAVVPINRSGGELDVLESVRAGRAEMISWSSPKGCFLQCYLCLAQSRQEGRRAEKGEVVAGRDSGGRERGKYNTVKRRLSWGTYIMGVWKARLGMVWRCVGGLWLSLLHKPAADQDEEPFPFIHREEEQRTQHCAAHLLVKLVFGVVLLIVSHGEDSWIFLESWRMCFTHPFPCPFKEKRKVKTLQFGLLWEVFSPCMTRECLVFSSFMHTACICFLALCEDLLLHDPFWPFLLWCSFQKISTWVYVFLHKENKQDF